MNSSTLCPNCNKAIELVAAQGEPGRMSGYCNCGGADRRAVITVAVEAEPPRGQELPVRRKGRPGKVAEGDKVAPAQQFEITEVKDDSTEQ